MTGQIVLDASAAVHLVMESEYAGTLVETLSLADAAIAPDLFYCEVANSLWKYLQNGSLETNEALARMDKASSLIDFAFSSRVLAAEALIAAETHAHPVYDLTYAVLARRYGATVVTMDRRFLRLLGTMGIAASSPLIQGETKPR